MTIPANTAQIPDGSPLATPIYQVDASGKPFTSSNGQQVTITNVNANGQTTMSASAPVAIASNQTPLVCSTGTPTSVAAAASSTQLLAINGGRKGASFYYVGSALCYFSLFASGSTTSYSFQLPANQLYELPYPIYTGVISAQWSAVNGTIFITEMS